MVSNATAVQQTNSEKVVDILDKREDINTLYKNNNKDFNDFIQKLIKFLEILMAILQFVLKILNPFAKPLEALEDFFGRLLDILEPYGKIIEALLALIDAIEALRDGTS